MTHKLIVLIILNKIKKKEIAEALGISQKAVYNKMSGRTDFTVTEIIKLRDTFFPDKTLDYLMSKEESA